MPNKLISVDFNTETFSLSFCPSGHCECIQIYQHKNTATGYIPMAGWLFGVAVIKTCHLPVSHANNRTHTHTCSTPLSLSISVIKRFMNLLFLLLSKSFIEKILNFMCDCFGIYDESLFAPSTIYGMGFICWCFCLFAFIAL